MLQQLCDDLNNYYVQFNKGDIEKSITIRPIKYNDELVNDSIVFYNDKDENAYKELLDNLNALDIVSRKFIKE